VAKVTAAGAVQWVTFIGGSGADDGRGIVVDAADNLIVVGSTSSADLRRPIMPIAAPATPSRQNCPPTVR